MKAEEIGVALIGCGRIAGHHCDSIQLVDGTRLVAVCDIELNKASSYGTKYGVPCYENFYEMLDTHRDIDVVAIITPSGMHYEHSMQILSEYRKHLIIEKPTFLRLDHLNTVYNTAEAHGLKVFPVFQNRHNLAVQRVAQAIRSGELGEIRSVAVRVRWCRPQRYYDMAPWRGTLSHDGGALTNQGIHHVDLLRHLGGEVAAVSASMRTLGVSIEAEDSAVAQFRYSSGAVGVLEVTTAARPIDFEASISFVGSEGLAQIGGIAVNELQIFTPESGACKTHSEDFSGCIYGNGHRTLYQNIVATLKGEAQFPVSRSDCYQTISLLHAFYLSAESDKWQEPAKHLQSERLGRKNDEISTLYRTFRKAPLGKVQGL